MIPYVSELFLVLFVICLIILMTHFTHSFEVSLVMGFSFLVYLSLEGHIWRWIFPVALMLSIVMFTLTVVVPIFSSTSGGGGIGG